MKNFFVILLIILANYGFSQVNAYARVTAAAGTSLTVASVNQASHTFMVGDWVVIMQMQDNVIGANTADNVNFGNLSAISSAGLYEIRQILSINGNATVGYSSGAPTTVVVDAVANTYNINANSRVQLITFRQMSAGNFTTTGNITALDWDGNVGGVIAFEVPGVLTLNHNISADGNGFRGGAASTNLSGPLCQPTPYRANNLQAGWKGEGIYRSTNTLYNNSRAKILNGGGGGVNHNGGGGGGGNYSAGGIGGGGWNGGASCPANTGYGFGGISLSTHVAGNRTFMGGGGGGGQGNNGVTTAGGDGGGIILIKADEITTTGSCAGRTITANGLNVPLAGNDGSGGGGAAGSILFFVNTWSIGASCDLTVQSNGGTGGSVNSGIHGGGGAGAQGLIAFNGTLPTTNITTTTLNGIPGCNNNSNPCNSPAGTATGTNNSGIITGTGNPLPIQLLYFDAKLVSGRQVDISWATSVEINNDYFKIQRSVDGLEWETISEVNGAGNSVSLLTYGIEDLKPLIGLSYYRLMQVDFDGKTTHSTPRSIFNTSEGIHAFPNPATHVIRFVGVDFVSDNFQILDMFGKQVKTETSIISYEANALDLDVSMLAAGTYILISANKKERFVVID